MYKLEYVRKRKRRRIVAFVGAISSVVVLSFAIIAFLGRFVGTFTVSLEARNVTLTLMETEESEEHSSFMRVDVAAPFQEFTYHYFDLYGGFSKIDNEETTYEYGAEMRDGKIKSFNFFKYTFYLENYGTQPARFDWFLNIAQDLKAENGESLLDTLRVIVFVDADETTYQKPTVYGKALNEPHYDNPEQVADYRAPISVDKDKASDAYPFIDYAEDFYSSDVVVAFLSQNIDRGQTIRYTVVYWLEGFRSNPDPDDMQFAPRGAAIKLGVDINAYENK